MVRKKYNIEITKSRGRRKHLILNQKFNFGGRKTYKLKQDKWNKFTIDINQVRANPEDYISSTWDLSIRQFRGLLETFPASDWQLRTDAQFNGMIDMVERNENPQFRVMTEEERLAFIEKLQKGTPYRVSYNHRTGLFEMWCLALGGWSFKLRWDIEAI